MRSAITLALVLGGVSQPAAAQTVTDPLTQLKACSQLERLQRLECLDKLSSSLSQPRTPGADTVSTWVFSETTSPVDYSPVIAATTAARDASTSLLSVQCRGGRTDVVMTGDGVAFERSADGHLVTYQVNGDPPVQLRWSVTAAGTGVSFKGNVVRFLRSLPDEGEISIRVPGKQGAEHGGQFMLNGLRIVREKVGVACRWPPATTASTN